MRTKDIILASVLGGTGLVILSLFLLPILLLRRRRQRRQRQHPQQHPQHPDSHFGRPSTSAWKASTDRPRTSDTRTIRPVTPSPSRLPPSSSQFTLARLTPPFLTTTRWDLEKARNATTPPGHPALMTMTPATLPRTRHRRSSTAVSRVAAGYYAGYEYNHQMGQHLHHEDNNCTPIFPRDSNDPRRRQQQQQQYLVPLPPPLAVLPHQPPLPPPQSPPPPPPQPEESISSTFAAEMSSLLDSISFKSSYSSLRSGDRTSTITAASGQIGGPSGLSPPPPIMPMIATAVILPRQQVPS